MNQPDGSLLSLKEHMALISQISYEPVFLKGLLEKLKVGNRRGIHLNALPGQHRARIDLKDLD
ncbi:MAG: hypothetical protein AABY09_05220, partial [Nanoarchaeota archaeon]